MRTSQKIPGIVTTIGIDIGKNTFHLVGFDQRGAIILQQKVSRSQLERRDRCVVAWHIWRRLAQGCYPRDGSWGFDAGPPHKFAQGEAHWPAHTAIDRWRLIIGIDARHTEMAEHDRLLGGRDTIDPLMGLKGMTAVGRSGIEFYAGHCESPR
jgi:hypothetical protein